MTENQVSEVAVRRRIGDRIGIYFSIAGPDVSIGKDGKVALILTTDQTAMLYQDLELACLSDSDVRRPILVEVSESMM